MLATIRSSARRCARAYGDASAVRMIHVTRASDAGAGDASTAATTTGGVRDEKGDRDAAFLADRKRWRAEVNSLRKQWREDFETRAQEKERARL